MSNSYNTDSPALASAAALARMIAAAAAFQSDGTLPPQRRSSDHTVVINSGHVAFNGATEPPAGHRDWDHIRAQEPQPLGPWSHC
jgi:hypothetical protein